MSTPKLPTITIGADPNTCTNVIWCEWCEAEHAHGAPFGERGRHCEPGSGQPFGAYILVKGRAGKPGDATPPALFAGSGEKLRTALDRNALKIRKTVAAAVLGLSQSAAKVLVRKTIHGRARIAVENGLGPLCQVRGVPADEWSILRVGGQLREGQGIVDLAARLYGVSFGVVVVRTIEAALGIPLDAQATREIHAAVNGWAFRGRPGPQSGPDPHRS